MTARLHPIAALDVPLPELVRTIARQKFAARMERLDWLKAHPENALVPNPADAGERAEWSHFLHDANSDDTTRPFVDLRKGRKL